MLKWVGGGGEQYIFFCTTLLFPSVFLQLLKSSNSGWSIWYIECPESYVKTCVYDDEYQLLTFDHLEAVYLARVVVGVEGRVELHPSGEADRELPAGVVGVLQLLWFLRHLSSEPPRPGHRLTGVTCNKRSQSGQLFVINSVHKLGNLLKFRLVEEEIVELEIATNNGRRFNLGEEFLY